MRNLALIVLILMIISTSPLLSQEADKVATGVEDGFLAAIGFAFQGTDYKAINVKLWTPAFNPGAVGAEPETDTTASSTTVVASTTASTTQFKKSELQLKYDQRMENQRPAARDGVASGASDIHTPRKSELQLKYDQRLRQGKRIVPGGADQPPIVLDEHNDGSLLVNGVEFKLKFVFYQADFSKLSADVFECSEATGASENQNTTRLPVPIGNLHLEKAPDYAISHTFIGEMSLCDEKTGTNGKFEIWLNDLSAQ